MPAVQDHLVNPEIIRMARQAVSGPTKLAFVPGGDPAAMGGGGMDPSMMDPAAMGGGMAPPAAPPADGGGGGGQLDSIMRKLDQMMMSGGGAGAGGAAGPLKPKIDVNVALMQISKMLARIADALGVHIPAHELIATPQDLTAMATQQQTGAPAGPESAGAAGPATGAIPPVGPLEGLQPAGMPGAGVEKQSQQRNGQALNSRIFMDTHNRASAIARILRQGAIA